MISRAFKNLIPAAALLFAVSIAAEETSPEYQRALELMADTPLIDGHNDVPWQYRERADNRLEAIDFAGDTSTLDPPMHTDLPRLRAGRVGAQFWSVYVSTEHAGDEAVRLQLEQLDTARRLVERHEPLELVTTADGIEDAFSRGRIASMLGLEGGHVLANSLATLRMYHALGARYLTLTHSDTHDWADSATDTPRHGGLSAFGEEVVHEMNRLGMLVDLSHVSAGTMHDVLDLTVAPVIFSHSSARAVTDHPRNVPDAVLDRLPENGGVVMVTFVTSFVSEAVRQWDAREKGEQARLERLYRGDEERIERGMEAWREDNPAPVATVQDVADHIDHLCEHIGAGHIGIGGDFDGISTTPDGLEDVSAYPNLIAELVRRGYSDDALRGIIGGNLLRVMRQVESVSERLRATRPASDAQFDDFAGAAAAAGDT